MLSFWVETDPFVQRAFSWMKANNFTFQSLPNLAQKSKLQPLNEGGNTALLQMVSLFHTCAKFLTSFSYVALVQSGLINIHLALWNVDKKFLNVLWFSAVIIRLCNQNRQANRVWADSGPHLLNGKTRNCRIEVFSTLGILLLLALVKCNFTLPHL